MKPAFWAIAFPLLLLAGCGKSRFEDAKAYNEYVVKRAAVVAQATSDLGDVLLVEPAYFVDSLRQQALDSTRKIISELDAVHEYEDETSFKTEVLNLLRVHERILSKDYETIIRKVDLVNKAETLEEYENTQQEIIDLVTHSSEDIEAAFKRAQLAQVKFCQKHNLNVNLVNEQ